jgi:hypothetical protein
MASLGSIYMPQTGSFTVLVGDWLRAPPCAGLELADFDDLEINPPRSLRTIHKMPRKAKKRKRYSTSAPRNEA